MTFGNSTPIQELEEVGKFLSAIFSKGHGKIFTTDNDHYFRDFTKMHPSDPHYYAICKVKDKSNGKLTRQNSDFTSLNILVCDDVGTKAAIPPLPPSYIIETSLGNFQYGFILDKPETDFVRANTLIKALIKSGYTDESAGGVVRLVRLPSGTNQKNGFKVRLVTPLSDMFDPDKQYNYEDLLNMVSGGTKNGKKSNVIGLNGKPYEPYEIPEKIVKGGRNKGMTQLFGHYLATSATETVAVLLLQAYNLERCEPPLDDAELETIIKSIELAEARNIEKLDNAKKELLDNIYFIRELNLYYDVRDMSPVVEASLNKTYLQDFPGGSGNTPKAATFLALSSESKSAANLGWSPVNDRLITRDGKLLLNTYNGLAIEPREGDVQPWLDHLAHVIPEEDYRRALLWWIAFTIQRPAEKINWQPILLGVSGAGKDALFRPVARILGKSFKTIGNKDIKGDYDDGLYQTKLLHISEANGLRGAAIEFYKRITAIESADGSLLNIKCAGKVYQENICNVIVITNNLDAMKFDKDERRPFVLKAPNVMTEAMMTAYFDNWLHKDGSSALLYYLLKYDLSEFSSGVRPFKTTYFDELFDITRNDSERALSELLEESTIYDLLDAKLLFNFLDLERSSIRTVDLWLLNNGYKPYDTTFKIRKDGKCKPRTWRYKVGSKYDPAVCKQSGSEVYLAVEEVEKLLTSRSKKFG